MRRQIARTPQNVSVSSPAAPRCAAADESPTLSRAAGSTPRAIPQPPAESRTASAFNAAARALPHVCQSSSATSSGSSQLTPACSSSRYAASPQPNRTHPASSARHPPRTAFRHSSRLPPRLSTEIEIATTTTPLTNLTPPTSLPPARFHPQQAQCTRNLLAAAHYPRHDACITLTTNFHITVLNGKYALRRKPTDVLSFRLCDISPRRRAPSSTATSNPARTLDDHLYALRDAPYLDVASGALVSPRAGDDHPHAHALRPAVPEHLGDIFLSVEYCRRVARERRMSLHEYLLLASVHGMAHLVGYTHNTVPKRDAMKEAEVQVLDVLRERYDLEGDEDAAREAGKPFLPRSYLP